MRLCECLVVDVVCGIVIRPSLPLSRSLGIDVDVGVSVSGGRGRLRVRLSVLMRV
jgi:hypothetical protein